METQLETPGRRIESVNTSDMIKACHDGSRGQCLKIKITNTDPSKKQDSLHATKF